MIDKKILVGTLSIIFSGKGSKFQSIVLPSSDPGPFSENTGLN